MLYDYEVIIQSSFLMTHPRIHCTEYGYLLSLYIAMTAKLCTMVILEFRCNIVLYISMKCVSG